MQTRLSIVFAIRAMCVASLFGSLAVASEPPAFVITGYAVDVAGKPIPGAKARFLAERTAPAIAIDATCDNAGDFEIAVERGGTSGRLLVSAPGYSTTLFDKLPSVSRRFAIGPVVLQRPLALRGHVTDPNGAPIAGALVVAALEPDVALRDSAEHLTATTNAAGEYRLDGVPRANVPLVVSAKDCASHLEVVDLRGGASGDALDFVLPRAARLHGKVVDARGEPLAGAAVALGSLFESPPSLTKEDGSFEVAPSTDAAAEVVIRVRGKPTKRFPSTAITKGPLSLDDGHPVAVVIDGSGRPSPIVRVRYDVFVHVDTGWKHSDGVAEIGDALVDNAGTWRIGVPDGDRVRVRAIAADGRESTPVELDLKAEPKGGFMVSAILPAYGTLKGQVVGPTGEPLDGMLVEVGKPNEQSLTPKVWRTALTDAQGRFDFGDIEPGAYSVRAVSEKAVSPPLLTTVIGANKPGAPPPAELKLNAAIGARVDGHVVVNGVAAAQRLPVLAMHFQQMGQTGGYTPIASTLCDAKGAYEIGPFTKSAVVLAVLRPKLEGEGVWHDVQAMIEQLGVRTSPNRVNILDPSPAHGDVIATFPPRGFLYGTLLVNGTPRPFGRLIVSRAATRDEPVPTPQSIDCDARGGYRVALDGGGTFEIAIVGGALRARRAVEFEAGTEKKFDLELHVTKVTGAFKPLAGTAGPLRAALEGEITQVEVDARLANPSQRDDTPWVTRAEAALSPTGEYEFPEVEAGRYRVAIEDVSHSLARVATEPFVIAPDGKTNPTPPIALPTLEVPPAVRLVLRLAKSVEDGKNFPFAAAKVTAADGAPPLPRTFVGWFVGDSSVVDGIPPGKVKIDVQVFGGKWSQPEVQTIELKPDGAPAEVRLAIEPKE